MDENKGHAEPAGGRTVWTLSRFMAHLAQILDVENFDEEKILAAAKDLVRELDQQIDATFDDGEEEEDDMQDDAEARRALRALADQLNLSERQVDLIASSVDPEGAAKREIDYAGHEVYRRAVQFFTPVQLPGPVDPLTVPEPSGPTRLGGKK